MAIEYTNNLTPIQSWKELSDDPIKIEQILGVRQLQSTSDNDATFDIGTLITSKSIYDAKDLFDDLNYAHNNNGVYDKHGINVNLKGKDGSDGNEGNIIPYDLLCKIDELEGVIGIPNKLTKNTIIPNPQMIEVLINLYSGLLKYTWREDTSITSLDSQQRNYLDKFKSTYPSMYSDIKSYMNNDDIKIFAWLAGSWVRLSEDTIDINIKGEHQLEASEGFFKH